MLLAVISCATGSSGINPAVPSMADNESTHVTSTAMKPGHNLLGYYTITIDSETESGSVAPVRAADTHLNVLTFLEFGPCTDCLSLTNFQHLPSGDLSFDVMLTHPFSIMKFSGFDVRGIAMFNGDLNFPNHDVTASSLTTNNPVLLNADGHTTLYNPTTVGNGMLGYLKGKNTPPTPNPTATLNGFKTYYTNEDRRYFTAGDELSANYVISSPIALTNFGYAIDASWAKPTEPVTVPDSFPLTANSLEAYRIEASVDVPLESGAGSTAILTVDVYDWQGPTTIQGVSVEAPQLWTGSVEPLVVGGGPADKRFEIEITNEFGTAPAGDCPVLICVTDNESRPGDLIDNLAWTIIQVPVILNNAPTCMADVSNFEPDPAEVITFTDTSTDPEGPSDIVLSEWDWNNDGTYDETGDEVTHFWPDAGIYYVNHKVTDASDAWDELDELLKIDVGLFISIEEDLAFKPAGRTYHYQSLDSSYNSGAIIDVDDFDGPWDFTTIGLLTGPNRLSIIDAGDGEVSAFAGDFNAATTHFMKYENMFDPFFPLLYQAEYHDIDNSQLFIYGFHDPYVIGSSPFGPPDTVDSLVIPYPLTTSTDYSFDINEPGFILNYTAQALGEGDVTVPYDGGTTYHCILMMYRFHVSSMEPVNGGTLNFAFVTDDGMIVANVIAVNDPPSYNWNTSTDKINSNGDTLFQALNTITDD